MKKIAAALMLVTIITKLFGFFREIIVSYYYGASYISDAYLIALTIPGTLFSVIGAGILAGYIPMYSRIEKSKNSKEADLFTNNLIHMIFIACLCMITVVLIFTKPIVKMFASGFEGEVLKLASDFTKISIFGILFTSITCVLTGYLNVRKQFLVPVLMSFPLNICIILSIFLSHHGNLSLLVIGSVIAEGFQLLFLLPSVYKYGFRYHFGIDLKNVYLKQILLLTLPVILGISVNQINVLIDKTIASQITAGGISALNYANRLTSIIQGIYIASISTILYPSMSEMTARDNLTGFKNSINKAVITVTLLVIPATVGFMILAGPIVTFLYGRGAFQSDSVKMTSTALFYYSIGMLGYGLRDITSRAFYALQDTKTPMINAAAGMAANIILNLILSSFMGIGGLALATSIVGLLTTFLMLVSLRKKIGAFGLKQIIITLIKILSAAAIMGFAVKLFYRFAEVCLAPSAALILTVFLGISLYCIVLCFMKIEMVDTAVALIRRKMKVSLPVKLPRPKERYLQEQFARVDYRSKALINVGIVIITHNNLEELKKTLDYIKEQKYRYYTAYVINNGSTDGTDEYLMSFIRKNHKFLYYKIQSYSGSAGGFYYGLRTAYEDASDYIWVMNDHVFAHRDALAELILASRIMGENTCLLCNTISDLSVDTPLLAVGSKEKLLQADRKDKFIQVDRFAYSDFFIPKTLIDWIGFPRKELYQGFELIEYSEKAKKAGYRIYLLRDALIQYRELQPVNRKVKLMGKIQEIPSRTKEDWYYYMRNGVLVYSARGNKKYRREHFGLLIWVLKAYPDCFQAALKGYLDGKKGITGKQKI